jgi:hypothetical protein
MNLLRQLILLTLCTTVFGADAGGRPNQARSAVSRWVDVERSISGEAVAWKEKRELLDDLIQVANTEIANLERQIAKADESTGVADARRAELVATREKTSANAQRIQEFLKPTEVRLLALKRRLPKPLQETLAGLFRRIPTDPTDTTLGIAERMQTVVGILSAIQKFDSLVTVSEGLRELKDGSTGEIRTLYIGLGAAYYLSGGDTDAGVGVPTPDGWTWSSQPELADAIREAIAIAENKSQVARFIPLPVKVRGE